MRRLAGLVTAVALLSAGCEAADGEVVLPGAADILSDSQTPPSDLGNVAEPGDLVSDLGLVDVPAEQPDSPVDCEAGQGCFGEPCHGSEDCNSGICTMHLGEKVCSKTCDEACPSGWDCTLVDRGADSHYACLSRFSHLCLPCEDSGACSGAAPSACVEYDGGSSFCGGACDADTPCPSGYTCQEVPATHGGLSFQCVNTAGVCPCTGLAIDSALSTPCSVDNELGQCAGVRICGPDGLGDCTAMEASVETCNGVDDNCNGLTDESACNDGNDCTEDQCAGDAGCVHDLLLEGECLDGDACTIGDHCSEGVCVGTLIDCDDGNPCTTDSCDGLGGCSNEALVAVCDDGDPCTLGDLCQEGVCSGTASLICDDQNPCTDDACTPSGCVSTPNNIDCDDASACTIGDSCTEGSCLGAPVVCDDANLCTTDSCDPAAGCVQTPNSQPCDDGDTCTQQDTCHEGGCQAGPVALNCDDGNPCTEDSCDSELGCQFEPNSAPCDDTNSCTTEDTCMAGNCIGLGLLVCEDGDPCTDDSCDPSGGCVHGHNTAPCDDANPCTESDTCSGGACTAGPPLECSDGDLCNGVETCEPTLGCVQGVPLVCDDGDPCNGFESCSGALGCEAGEALQCDDGNPCTVDGCDVEQGCVHGPMDGPCDDGSPCTVDDHCAGTFCVAASMLLCDDLNGCTDDLCDDALGCLHPHNSAPCDDGDACTVADACVDGACVAFAALVCDDENPCTDDDCDVLQGCTTTDNSSPCDDLDACTTGDLCEAGQCVAGPPVDCDDGDVCTDDICDAASGCDNTPNEAPCDDSDDCTLGDTCSGGACEAGAETLQCDDLEPCTTDSCDANLGCQHTTLPDGADCGNGNTCQDGLCTSPCTPGSQTFEYSGQPANFTVPQGCTSILVEAWGAQGGRRGSYSEGGPGGFASGSLACTSGESLVIHVGQYPGQGTSPGWNGGGTGDLNGHSEGGGGGGASDVRQGGIGIEARVIVAGGGGGGGGMHQNDKIGGAGGGLTGGTGQGACPGFGGGQDTAGVNGPDQCNETTGGPGTFAQGGDGASGGCGAGGGGGGGGGWYGGGGGGSCNSGGSGGGGGSSHLGGVTNGSLEQGVKTDHGRVILTWPAP